MSPEYEAMTNAQLYDALEHLAAERRRIRAEQLLINDLLSRRMYEAGEAGPPSAAAVVRANIAEGFSQ